MATMTPPKLQQPKKLGPTIDKSKTYGLLHDVETGENLKVNVKFLKIAFGRPSGPDLHVYYLGDEAPDGKPWRIQVGTDKVFAYKDQYEAEREYNKMLTASSVPQRRFPVRYPYFTFVKMGKDGDYVYDFDAIKAHGRYPTEVGIVFLSEDNALESGFQAWNASKLLCDGNGKDARRHVDWAQGPEEKKLAQAAIARDEQYFLLEDQCAARGCNLCRGDKAPCGPRATLYTQLANAPRIGGMVTYETTGWRSVKQLGYCLETIRAVTGRISGIKLTLKMAPYRAKSPDGKLQTQYAVSIECKAEDALQLAQSMAAQAYNYQQAMTRPLLQIEENMGDPIYEDEAENQDGAGIPKPLPNERPYTSMEHEAEILSAEFYNDEEGEERGVPSDTEPAANDQPAMPGRKSEKPKQTEPKTNEPPSDLFGTTGGEYPG